MKFIIIREEAMKLFKTYFLILMILLTFTSCKSLKEGLSGQKGNNTDEFLLEKKNPLTRPPNYEELPLPKNEINKELNEEESINLKTILGKKKIIKKSTISKEKSALEKLILKKISKD